MSTMAEVIERFLSANYPCACEGDCPGEHAEAVELADALAKAGYGKLADARATELEAAADGWREHTRSLGLGTTEPIRWLRDRAAVIRAGAQ